MKKHLLFTLIGAVVLFFWLFMSFAMPNFHKASQSYTPLQDSLLMAMEKSGLPEGMYVLGQPDPAFMNDEAKCAEEMKKFEGKPWAVLNYQMNNSYAMGMNMVRGFFTCAIISWLLFWLMGQMKERSLKNDILLSLAIGFISFCFVPYTNFIWFKNPDILAHLLDGIGPWLILGWVGNKLSA
ncbi:MAG: hypothetical protein K9H61_12950 [Bacteroidia bacterium]|nr:hypothetical protein [Bacteroidia bacterium]MCF8425157.1 hypothetical protein [Bacteroidia bacterium]MCF8447891.1 hypothetical protein [Bacteroidia bacterium]